MDMKIVLDFLGELKNNNNKGWFDENRGMYQKAKGVFEDLVNILILELKKVDGEVDITGPKECVFRIFRDVRFSKNKSPYKTNFGAYMKKGGRNSPYAGYYLHVEPGDSFIAGGIYMPDPPVLKAVRERISETPEEINRILDSAGFIKFSDGLYDDKLKSAPRGFDKDHPHIELLKYKHYISSIAVKDDFWLSGNLINKVTDIFRSQYPLVKFVNDTVKSVT